MDADFDPQNLTQILLRNLRKQSNWISPLEKFKQLLIQIKTNQPHLLSDPYTDFTNYLIDKGINSVVEKLLNSTLQPEDQIVLFLEEVINLISIILLISEKKSKLISILNTIFNLNQNFYIYHGRNEDQQYSVHAIRLAQIAIRKNLIQILSTILENYSLVSIDDIFEIIKLFVSLSKLIKINQFLPRNFINSQIQIFTHFTSITEIPYKQILEIINNLIEICPKEQLNDLFIIVIEKFIESDKIDLKISAVKLSVLYFTKICNDNSINKFSSLNQKILMNITNYDLLKLYEPILIKFSQANLLNSSNIEHLWSMVQKMPAYKNGFQILFNAAIKSNQIQKLFDLVACPPITIDYLVSFIQIKEFKNQVVFILFSMIQENQDPKAIESLLTISKTVELNELLPLILLNIQKANLLLVHVKLISAIIKTQKIDLNSIFACIYGHPDDFSEDELCELFQNICEILQKIGENLPIADFQKLFQLSKKLINYSFLPNRILVDFSKDTQVFKNMIQQSDLDSLKHLFLNTCLDIELNEIVFDRLFGFVLFDEKLKKESSIILLSKIEYLYKYISKCMNELNQNENKNAALFLSDCLHQYFTYFPLITFESTSHHLDSPLINSPQSISFDSPHLISHQFNLISITFLFDNIAHSIKVDSQITVEELAGILAFLTNQKVFEIELNYPKKNIKLNEIPMIESHIFEVVLTKKKSDLKFENIFDMIDLNRLLSLLNSPISKEIYDVLIQLPTPTNYQFKLETFSLYPCKSKFLYDLHYLAKLDQISHNSNQTVQMNSSNSNEQIDLIDFTDSNQTVQKSDENSSIPFSGLSIELSQRIRKICENTLIYEIQSIDNETRYLLSILIDSKSKNEDLVNICLYQLSKENDFYVSQNIWKIVSNFSMELDDNILDSVLFNDNKRFLEAALNSHLILSQKFEKVFRLFKKNLKNFEIFGKFEIPIQFCPEMYQILFENINTICYPIFESMFDNWNEFPIEPISEYLIKKYIKCINSNLNSYSPFSLLCKLIKKSEKVRTNTLKEISLNRPIRNWNYSSVKTHKLASLINSGATCYINSVMQLLFLIQPIKQNFIQNSNQISINQNLTNLVNNSMNSNYSNQAFDNELIALKKLFMQMEYSIRQSIDISEFIEAFSINKFIQQDAGEFLMLLLNKLDKFKDLFTFKQIETIKSENSCETQISSSNILPLNILGFNSLAESMHAFSLPEKIDKIKKFNQLSELPPYLFVQLKRFDYSIENQQRIKLNQIFEFEMEFEFEQNEKFELIGVINHQGDVDFGHYFSYVKYGNEWFMINDSNIIKSTQIQMKNNSYGCSENTSAYILLYRKIDTKHIQSSANQSNLNSSQTNPNLLNQNSLLSMSINQNQNQSQSNQKQMHSNKDINRMANGPKIEAHNSNKAEQNSNQSLNGPNSNSDGFNYTEVFNEILKDNHQIEIDNVYFTSYFSHFAFELLTIDKTLFPISLDYFFDSLSHSKDLTNEFNLFTIRFSNIIQKKEYLNLFIEYLQNNIQLIVKIMASDASKIIKYSFSNLIKQAFQLLPIENDLIVLILALLIDWFKQCFDQNDFDLFKVLSDFASIDQGHSQCLKELHIDDQIISQITKSTQSEKFKHQVDFTFIFKLFECLQTNISTILHPSFFEWCILSEFHQKSLIHCLQILCPDCLNQIDQYIKPDNRPSEFFIAELILNNIHTNFQFYNDLNSTSKLLKALLANPYEKFIFSNNEQIMFYLIFSDFTEIRNKIPGLLEKVQNVNDLVKFIDQIPLISRCLFERFKTEYLPIDSFTGLQYLIFLTQKVDMKPHFPLIQRVFHDLLQIPFKRDEHAIQICGIALDLFNDISIDFPDAFLNDIFVTISKMIPDHKSLDFFVDKLINGFEKRLRHLQINQLFSQNNLKEYMIQKLLLKNHKNKQFVLKYFALITSRYATASSVFKSILNELKKHAEIDFESFFWVFSEFDINIINSNKIFSIELILNNLHHIQNLPNRKLEKLGKIINHLSSDPCFIQSVSINPLFVEILFKIACNNSFEQSCRLKFVSIIEKVIFTVNCNFEYVYCDYVLSDYFDSNEIDKFIAMILIKLFSMPVNNEVMNQIQEKMAIEIISLVNNSIYIFDVANFLLVLTKFKPLFVDKQIFLNKIVEGGVLLKLWTYEPSNEIDYEGLYELSQLVLDNEEFKKQFHELFSGIEHMIEDNYYHELLYSQLMSIL